MDDLAAIGSPMTYKFPDALHRYVACSQMQRIYLVDILIKRPTLFAQPSANSFVLKLCKLQALNVIPHELPPNSPIMRTGTKVTLLSLLEYIFDEFI